MARISGVDIPREKRVEVSLTYISGSAGAPPSRSARSPRSTPDTRVRNLTDDEVARLRGFIDSNVRVEGDLRREVSQDIKRKMEIGCYQGLRHRRGLPVRGSADPYQCPHPKGPEADRGRQEEGQEVGNRRYGETHPRTKGGRASANART